MCSSMGVGAESAGSGEEGESDINDSTESVGEVEGDRSSSLSNSSSTSGSSSWKRGEVISGGESRCCSSSAAAAARSLVRASRAARVSAPGEP